uniref:Uncharacterized protein ycf33 n=1 Tax=Cucumis melo TaxID=3656 RepID=A0A9I9ELQ9_CUCME
MGLTNIIIKTNGSIFDIFFNEHSNKESLKIGIECLKKEQGHLDYVPQPVKKEVISKIKRPEFSNFKFPNGYDLQLFFLFLFIRYSRKIPHPSNFKTIEATPSGKSRQSSVSMGVALFLIGCHDNVRRYAIYVLIVSTGAIYTIFLPILELLKNLINAVLVLPIFGGVILQDDVVTTGGEFLHLANTHVLGQSLQAHHYYFRRWKMVIYLCFDLEAEYQFYGSNITYSFPRYFKATQIRKKYPYKILVLHQYLIDLL